MLAVVKYTINGRGKKNTNDDSRAFKEKTCLIITQRKQFIDLNGSTNLFSVSFNNVTFFHFQTLWSVFRLNTLSLVQESQGVWLTTLSLTEGFHESLQLGDLFDLEENFGATVGDLQVNMGGICCLWLWFFRHVLLCGASMFAELLAALGRQQHVRTIEKQSM